MRPHLLVLLVGACAAAPEKPEEFSSTGQFPVGGASHALVWEALCRVSVREAEGALIRVDSVKWEVRCGDRFLCHAPPGADAVQVSHNGDLEWYIRFASRFHEALGKLHQVRTPGT